MMLMRSRLLILLLAGVLAATPVLAGSGTLLTVGFTPAPVGLVRDAAEAQRLAERLAARLGEPVQLRLLESEEQLFQWLSRYREIDIGWFSLDFLRSMPAGEVLPLAAAAPGAKTRTRGRFVARQGIAPARLEALRAALLAIGDDPIEPPLLKALDINRFIAAGELDRAERQGEAAASVPTTGAPAQPAPEQRDLPVVLSADALSYDRAAGIVTAGGAVELQQGQTTLVADELLWQETTRDALATGSVRLAEPDAELRGSAVQANLTTGRGFARDGEVFLKERNFHLAGTEIERLGESSFRVAEGRFTTCDGEVPDWQFTAREVRVDLGRFAVARDVWFEIADQPLLYLPYLLFPVRSERESGFLLPRAGYSSRKGAILSLAWYQVIDRHLDATVYLDTLSRIGLGKGLEYRYALDAASAGEALYYHVSGFDDTPDSYLMRWRHDGRLPGEVRLAADVEYVNRREFFEDFGESADEYNRDWTVSTVLAERNWGKLALSGHLRYLKNLQHDNDATLQRLPEFGVDVPFFRLDDTPLYTLTQLRATRFWREEGEDGERLSLRQGLGLVLKPGSWLEATPEVAVYGRAYHADARDESDLLPEYGLALSTRLLRVFPVERWGVEKVQHSIEPQLRYRYIPNRDQDDLPFFDLKDRIGPLNLLEYALVNRLTTRTTDVDGASRYRELLNLRLSQSYDIREERDDSIDDPEPFSDLRTELTLRPGDHAILEVDAYTRVHGDLQFSRFRAGAGYDDGRGNQARLDYRYRRDEVPIEPTDYLELSLATSWLDPVHLQFGQRYDFQERTSLETLLGIEYRSGCWSLFLTLRDRPDSEEVLVGFALAGLGRVGGYGGALRPLDDKLLSGD